MKERLSGIDSLRGAAALMIMVYHLSFTVKFPEYLAVINYWFGIAVPLFFLISAFSIYYGYYNNLNDADKVKKYLVRRFLRIAPIFYLMIIIYSIFFPSNYSFSEYLIDFTLMYSFFPGLHGSIVGAGWSISILFLFYLIVPILMAFVRKTRVSLLLLVLSLFISSYYFNYMSTLPGMPAWYMENYVYYTSFITHLPFFFGGIVCFLLIKKFLLREEIFKKRSTKLVGLGLVCSAIFIAFMIIILNGVKVPFILVPYAEIALYLWILVFSCLVIGFTLYPFKIFVNRVTKFIGDRSYSIYLLHPFLIGISMPVYLGIYRWINDTGAAFLISFLYTLILVLIISSITYRFIEQPALKYGNKLLGKLNQRISIKEKVKSEKKLDLEKIHANLQST